MHLTYDELTIAELADLALWFHAISINTASWVHSFLVEAIITAALATELAEVHLRILFENKVIATHTGLSLSLFAVGAAEEIDRVLIAELKLILGDAHLVLCAMEAGKFSVQLG